MAKTLIRLVVLLGGILALHCGFFSPTEIHLIPQGFRGDVFIVPGMRAGRPAEREGSSIVFRIPPNGILVTQDSPSQGWHLTWFYSVTPAGERHRLPEESRSVHDTPENRADTSPFIWFQRTGALSGVALPCPVNFAQYYVGTRAHLLSRKTDDELAFEQYVRDRHVCP